MGRPGVDVVGLHVVLRVLDCRASLISTTRMRDAVDEDFGHVRFGPASVTLGRLCRSKATVIKIEGKGSEAEGLHGVVLV